jgi:hypothetical protein
MFNVALDLVLFYGHLAVFLLLRVIENLKQDSI